MESVINLDEINIIKILFIYFILEYICEKLLNYTDIVYTILIEWFKY